MNANVCVCVCVLRRATTVQLNFYMQIRFIVIFSRRMSVLYKRIDKFAFYWCVSWRIQGITLEWFSAENKIRDGFGRVKLFITNPRRFFIPVIYVQGFYLNRHALNIKFSERKY